MVCKGNLYVNIESKWIDLFLKWRRWRQVYEWSFRFAENAKWAIGSKQTDGRKLINI